MMPAWTSKRAGFLIFFFVCGLFCLTPACFAGSEFDTDEELIFEDDTSIEMPAAEPAVQETLLDQFMDKSTVTLSYAFSYGTDFPEKIIDNRPGLRLEYAGLVGENLFLKFDGKTALHLKNDHAAEAREKDLYVDSNIRELYLQPGFEKFNLSIGKQVLVWGKADTAAITDVVSPRDLSRFLFTELEDARLGQWMISGSYFEGQWKTFVFLSPLPETDTLPDRGTRYYRQLINEAVVSVAEEEPEFGDMEFGIKLDTTFSKTDISFMAGHFYLNSPVYSYSGITPNNKLLFKQVFPSYTMLGTAVSYAWKSFIFKVEAAFKDEYALQGVTANSLYLSEKRDLIDAAAGVEYNANDKYQVTLELANRYIISGTSGLMTGTDENSTALYATVSKDFFNQTLDVEYTLYQHLKGKSRFQQFKITYDLTDNIQLKADYTFFNVTDTG